MMFEKALLFFKNALLFPFPPNSNCGLEKGTDVRHVKVCSRLEFGLRSGAIIGDGDRKRASFLVLGLAP